MYGRRFAAGLLFAAAVLSCGCADTGEESSARPAVPAKTEVIDVHIVTDTEPVKKAAETETQTTAATQTTTVTTAEETTAEPVTEPADDGQLVLIKDYIPDIHLDLRYATENNFTGKVIYENDDAYLCYGTVKKLMAVQSVLREKGLSLIIWDPYRPVEAQQKLWEVCPDPVFVADPRNGITSHSRGNTVDLGIVSADGSYIPVPSDFDEFSSLADRSYTDVPEEAAANSQLLEDVMTANGFHAYWNEWWHYTDNDEYNWHF